MFWCLALLCALTAVGVSSERINSATSPAHRSRSSSSAFSRPRLSPSSREEQASRDGSLRQCHCGSASAALCNTDGGFRASDTSFLFLSLSARASTSGPLLANSALSTRAARLAWTMRASSFGTSSGSNASSVNWVCGSATKLSRTPGSSSSDSARFACA